MVGVLAAAAWSCKAPPPPLPDPAVNVTFKPKDAGRRAETDAALTKALAFVKPLAVQPWRVRDELGMKGMKHFVEKVQLLRMAAEWPGDEARRTSAAIALINTLAVTQEDRFHGLLQADDERFREDGMSYVRACWLAGRAGFDTTAFQLRIAQLRPRFEADQRRRGASQRMAISGLHETLGLPFSEKPEDVYAISRIGTRVNPQYWQQHPSNTYDLTHEVFALTRRGARPLAFKSDQDRRYTITMVRTLLDAHMRMNNPDMVAELMVNRVQLGEPFDRQLEVGRKFLLERQNPDGSFGRYDEAELRKNMKNPRYDARIGGYLHTTMVVMWALMATS